MGKVKQYHLPVESVTMLSLPLSYFLFKWTDNPESVFYSMIALALAAHIVRVLCLRKYYAYFSVKAYLADFLFRAVVTTSIVAGLEYVLIKSIGAGWLQFVMVVGLSVVAVPLLAYNIGINRVERESLVEIVNRVVKKRQ